MYTSDFSDYANFHLKFLGKFIRDNDTGKLYRKSVFFDKFRSTAKLMILGGKSEKFTPVDRPGWKNGELVDEKLFMPEANYYINKMIKCDYVE